mmetsp:Transcript_67312/g.161389  ORF Transcript_67312/g.161389 Transcript_67312/m.161389 type:complete len:90 (+) Transcript_67312:2713-2982(+)
MRIATRHAGHSGNLRAVYHGLQRQDSKKFDTNWLRQAEADTVEPAWTSEQSVREQAWSAALQKEACMCRFSDGEFLSSSCECSLVLALE